MRISLAPFAALAFRCSLAIPHSKRVSTLSVDDSAILNFSLTLEYLQRAFYREGFSNFTHQDFIRLGFEDPFYSNLQHIYRNDQDHVTFLAQALQAASIPQIQELNYTFPYSDIESWVALAGVLESISASA